MARGGGGGGRGGGGRGGRARGGSGYSRPMTKLEAVVFFPVLILLLLSNWYTETFGPESYDEQKLETFCQQQYDAAFRDTQTYEDNVLLTIVVYEDRSDYSYMTWVGDHINDETFAYLRGDGTRLDRILENSIQLDYTNTLASDLSHALRELAAQIDEATEYGSYTCTEGHSENPSGFKNLSEMDLNETLIGSTIGELREQTGIPFVLVVEDAKDIFG